MPHVIAGLPPTIYQSITEHNILDEAANTAFITLIGNQSFEEILTLADSSHQKFVQMLSKQDENIFVPGNYVYERLTRVIDHHLEHAIELEAAITKHKETIRVPGEPITN